MESSGSVDFFVQNGAHTGDYGNKPIFFVKKLKNTSKKLFKFQKIMYYNLHNTYYRGLLLCLDSDSSEYWYFFV